MDKRSKPATKHSQRGNPFSDHDEMHMHTKHMCDDLPMMRVRGRVAGGEGEGEGKGKRKRGREGGGVQTAQPGGTD